MNASTMAITNALRRPKLVAIQRGTAEIGTQYAGNDVKIRNAFARAMTTPNMTNTPIWTRKSRSRFWPKLRR